MSEALNKNRATETAACCCVDVGTIMDNSDCTASWSAHVATRREAEAMLAALATKAHQVESEPCFIAPRFTPEGEGIRLDIDFTFCCQAETMIFQLGLR